MSRSHLDQLWSRYTTSPDPLSGMESLYQACLRLTRHVLKPSDLVLSSLGSYVLRPQLAEPLSDVIPAMDSLLLHAAQHHGFWYPPSIGQSELQVLTAATVYATEKQIVLNWDSLMARLASAMRELKGLCMGNFSEISSTQALPLLLLPHRLPATALQLTRARDTSRTAPASTLLVPGRATPPVTVPPSAAKRHPRTLPAQLRVPPPPWMFPAPVQSLRSPTTQPAVTHVSDACRDSCSPRCWSQSRRTSAKEHEESSFVIVGRCATNEPKPIDALGNGVEAVKVARVTPPPKSPAPAPAIADTVELGGLRVEVTRSRATLNATAIKDGGLAASSSSPPAAPTLDCDEGVVELEQRTCSPAGGAQLSTTPRISIQRTIVRASPTHVSSSLRLLAASFPSASASGSVARVSAILRTYSIPCLACTRREDRAPLSVWEREGIGTCRRT
ncbi:hypothetical protein B0H15DRAFT_840505 [Mycena belliarum]|uniref:Uncharacterized protein n=1 Tax=Mycena belliarum TaxID=1033014 RepID=A0AAD6XRB1_9AGAR|nr:hypothetical protein B0H15DRAFT_840505 [Mycena belliae]